jgi:hypothetical protein
MAGMAGVSLLAPRGARDFTDVQFVGQSDPVGLDSAAGGPSIP